MTPRIIKSIRRRIDPWQCNCCNHNAEIMSIESEPASPRSKRGLQKWFASLAASVRRKASRTAQNTLGAKSNARKPEWLKRLLRIQPNPHAVLETRKLARRSTSFGWEAEEAFWKDDSDSVVRVCRVHSRDLSVRPPGTWRTV